MSTSAGTATATIDLDRPFAVKDQAGTVAVPLLVMTSAVRREALVIVRLHDAAGMALQLS
ncbi:hypothetical protein ACGFIF_41830 [Kribbella sp. NPDC049174]|uniref:hypothetical protein n=1 Tax=Kribbella sp. NPDC049174 TaxID=3364112 RepID=UPI00371B6F55